LPSKINAEITLTSTKPEERVDSATKSDTMGNKEQRPTSATLKAEAKPESKPEPQSQSSSPATTTDLKVRFTSNIKSEAWDAVHAFIHTDFHESYTWTQTNARSAGGTRAGSITLTALEKLDEAPEPITDDEKPTNQPQKESDLKIHFTSNIEDEAYDAAKAFMKASRHITTSWIQDISDSDGGTMLGNIALTPVIKSG
jgi:hypothetical protein